MRRGPEPRVARSPTCVESSARLLETDASIARLAALTLATLAIACDAPALDRSCAGEAVGDCPPYEHSVVRSALLEPDRLPVADFSERARIRVELARCERAPAPHVVELLALVPGPADAGASVRVMSLLTLRDGADGDAVAGDGVIEVEVVNPFIATVPAESDIALRFSPRSTTPTACAGESAEQPYRTGPMRSGP